MARDGSDDPNNYSDSDPTQYANYGSTGGEAYSDYQQSDYGAPTGYGNYPTPPEPTPWYRKPAALVSLGVLTAVILALLVYAVVKFTGSGESGPATTTTTAPTTTSAVTSASVAPEPGVTQTVTQSPTATSEPPATTTTEAPTTTTTTTEAPSTSTSTSTSTTVSTSVSTVTETVTSTTRERFMPTFPLPRPGG